LPPELGNWNSVYRQYRRWTTSGLWDVLMQALVDGGGDADALQMIDSTIVQAHHCTVGAKAVRRLWHLTIARILDVRAVASRPRSTSAPMPMAR
jgi:transposase